MNKKLLILPAVILILGVLTLLISGSYASTQGATATLLRDEVRLTKNKIEQAKVKESVVETNELKERTGFDYNIYRDDIAVIEELLRDMLTFNSFESYNRNRDTLLELVDENSKEALLQVYPEVLEFEDEAGNKHNRIDTFNANASFSGMKAHVTEMNGDDYTYMVVAKAASIAENGGISYFDVIINCKVNDQDEVEILSLVV